MASAGGLGPPAAGGLADAATLLGAIAGPDAEDPATQATGVRLFKDYREFLQPGGLKGARLGVLRAGSFNLASTLHPVLQNVVEVLKREGAELADPVEFPTLGQTDDAEYEVLLYEFKAGLEA